MAKIITLKDKDDVTLYPQTKVDAVFDNNGDTVDELVGEYVNNPEFVKVTIDSGNRILEGTRTDGTKVIGGDLQVDGAIINETLEEANDKLSHFENTENPEWISVTTDSEGKVLEGITVDGKKKVMLETEVEIINAGELNLSDNGQEKLQAEIIKDYIPSYYNNYLDSRASSILSDVMTKRDGNGDSFFFITDTHFQEENNNAGQSGKLIDYLAGKTSVDKIIHGGDAGVASTDADMIGINGIMKCIGWSREKLFKYLEKYDFLNVHGNHDYNNYYNTAGTLFNGISIPTVRNYIFNSVTVPFTADDAYANGMYYYYDNPVAKIRYIIVDTEQNQVGGQASMDNYFQLSWIHRTVQSLPDGYDLVFVGHMPIEETAANTDEYAAFSNLLIYIRAINNHRSGYIGGINYDFTDTTFKVVMVITGHTHADTQTFVDNVFHVATKCDKTDTSYPVHSPFDTWVRRDNGTIHEQAFDVVTIYNNHSDVQFRRIGDGYDRLFHTAKIDISVGETKDFTSLVEITPVAWVTNDGLGNTYSFADREWTLSNTILSVEDGVVTALQSGDAFMFAKDADGNKEFFYIHVN